jgi:predicted MPP superfamily phosphohydrolase
MPPTGGIPFRTPALEAAVTGEMRDDAAPLVEYARRSVTDRSDATPLLHDPARVDAASVDLAADCGFAARELGAPRHPIGRERRWLDAEHGAVKRFERTLDRFTARWIYPHLFGLWHPYCWLLPRRGEIATATLVPPRWPRQADGLRILHVSDIHCGAFLRPDVLAGVLRRLMTLRPDFVAITGDVVEGRLDDLDGFLPALATLTDAPLGAWYCLGNHDYFTRAPEMVLERLRAIGIRTLRNEATLVRGAGAEFVLGGVDDRTFGTRDWPRLLAPHGPPHLLLAHQPDDFYDAESRGVALVLAGHTHGGQIRFPGLGPIVRQSRFYLDEGVYVHGRGMLVVSRGLGAVGLPWRAGALPEAVLLTVRSPAS